MERGDATGTTTYAYDTQNRLVEERLAAGRVNAYSYDASGNLASITDATGTVSYSYNAVNLATAVVEPTGATTSFAYDDDDNRITTSYPNGVTQAVAYDDSGRLTSIAGRRLPLRLRRDGQPHQRDGAPERPARDQRRHHRLELQPCSPAHQPGQRHLLLRRQRQPGRLLGRPGAGLQPRRPDHQPQASRGSALPATPG